MDSQKSLIPAIIIGLIVLSGLISITATPWFFTDGKFIQLPLHSALETLGSAIAITTGFILLQLQQRKRGIYANVPIATALFVMGILDLFHAMLAPGQSFVWLHSLAAFYGGLLFLTAALPEKIINQFGHRFVISNIVIALLLSLLAISFEDTIPAMVINGEFTDYALTLNWLAGLFFLVSTVKLAWINKHHQYSDEGLFTAHSLLLAVSAFLFHTSSLWDSSWWGWHIIRLAAYGFVLIFVIKIEVRNQTKLKNKTSLLKSEVYHQKNMLEAVFNSAADSIITINNQGIIQEVNKTTEKMFGYHRKQLVGQPISILVPKQHPLHDINNLVTHLNNYKDDMVGTWQSLNGVKQNGQTFPMELAITHVEANEGVYFTGIVRDLTDSAEKQMKLDELRDRLEFALALSNIGVWDYNLDTNDLFWDERSFSLFDTTPDEFEGVFVAWESRVHPDDIERSKTRFLQCIENGEDFHDEFRIIRKSGEVRNIEGHGRIYEDPISKSRRFVGTNTDVTDSRKMTEMLVSSKNQAEEASRAKSNFLANMSHEIRTPMNGILGVLQILERQHLPEQSQALIDKGLLSSKTLISVINDILDFSKIEAGKLELEYIPTNVELLFETAVAELAANAEEKGIELKLNIEDNLHSQRSIDPVRLKQVILNLLSNGIKFTESGSVDIQLSQNDTGIEFTVTDTGIGMTPDTVAALFSRFEQADKSTTRKYGGTGLGMAITKQLVHLMKGELTVHSQLNHGSQFSIIIPCDKLDIETPQQQRKKQFPTPDLTGYKVLLAEDNRINQTIFKSMMGPTNATLKVANDGVQAVEFSKEFKPDLIFMDIQMPNMDGVDACKTIRKLMPEVPIIALTANTMKTDVESYLAAGFVAHIAKPVDINLLYREAAWYHQAAQSE